ncbi:hypothetical protein K501DRAFT_242404 [Backusella circina FSU 941]|nr:hypothetical protein K501DRAFT_242404 [Backusella circina FSU 941]
MTTEHLSFSNNFWGMKDDGYHALTAKINSTKRTFDEIKSFYNIRASLHEEFGRKLMKHCKNEMGKEECGTLNELLVSAHKEMEQTAKMHLGVSQKLKNRLEVELDNFILEQKEKRKLMQSNVEKAIRTKKLNENHLSRQREKYEADYVKLLGLQKQLSTANTQKDEERLKQKVERTQHEIKIQEQEYRNACIKLTNATEAWNQTWKIACDVYQGMEKKRLEFLYYSFSMYVNIISSGSSEDQESYERFWKSLDKYDPISDMELFIKQTGTGKKIPGAEIFVDYNDDPEKRLVKYHLADFELPAELTITPITPQKPKLTVRNPSKSIDEEQYVPEHEEEEIEVEEEEERKEKVVPQQQYKYHNEPSKMEPSTPNKSRNMNNETERRKSSVQMMKPLPSVSLPKTNSSQKSRASSTSSRTQSSFIQESQKVPDMNIPTMPNTPLNKFENKRNMRRKNTKNEKTGEDIEIDPRAKVVFAIGNNMFDLGHLTNESSDDIKPHRSHLYSQRHRKQSSADIEAACNISYRSLLKDIGIFDNDSSDTDDDTHYNKSSSSSSNSSKLVRQEPEEQNGTFIKDEKAILNESCEMMNPVFHTYTNNYTDNYHHQQQPSSDVYIPNDNHQYQSNGYNMPMMNTGQNILFWGRAIGDWYSSEPEQLQFSRGTLFGIVETRADGWYYAIKYDSRLNGFTNEKGYVAQNYMQIIR